jgi:hypothetical protein
MTTLILDPQRVARFTLDGDTTKSEAASKPAFRAEPSGLL